MDYKTPEEAKDMDGLRLALTAGLPAPWSMTARFMFDVKGIPYVPVAQIGGAANKELQAWTGHRNAPVAVYNDEVPRTNWTDIIDLAERLNPEPRLVPDNAQDRILMYGLANEICGAGGMTYSARHTMMGNLLRSGMDPLVRAGQRMAKTYGYTEEAEQSSRQRIQQAVDALAQQLKAQQDKGKTYFIGDNLSALDLIWAAFSNTMRPLPEDVNPMDPGMRKSYEAMGSAIDLDDALFAHRDMIYDKHLTLPLDY